MVRLALVGLLSLATDTLAVSLLGAGEGPGSCPAAPFRGQIRGFHPSNISKLFVFHSRGDCSLDILGASPAHTRDQDDVVEEEEAAVLPDTEVDVLLIL